MDNKNYEESLQRRTALFQQYVQPYCNLIYKLCIHYSFYKEDLDDNYNEVLVNFFKYIETYDPSRPLQTWLHIVTKRYIADLNQKHRSFPDSGIDIDDLDTESRNSEPSANCISIDNYRELYSDRMINALDSLRPIYREAILLQQAGYKLTEIMEISHRMGNMKTRNIETIKSRLFLAKQQMRKYLSEHGEQ